MIVDVIKKRRSIRVFKDEPVSRELIEEIIKAGMFSPSAKNIRPWEFIVADAQKLIGLTKWTKSLETARTVIVVIADKNKTPYWVEDCSVVAMNMLLQATSLGVSSCWVHIHGVSAADAENKVKKILEIPDNYGVLCMIAVGYSDIKKDEHSEEEFEKERIHCDKFS